MNRISPDANELVVPRLFSHAHVEPPALAVEPPTRQFHVEPRSRRSSMCWRGTRLTSQVHLRLNQRQRITTTGAGTKSLRVNAVRRR